jgi:hypothetical protein
MSHTIEPLALVFNALFDIDVLAVSMSETILNFSIIGGLVWPLVTAHSCDLIALEFTLVYGTICPVELTLAVEQAVFELSLVGVTVSKLTCSLTMIDFADL